MRRISMRLFTWIMVIFVLSGDIHSQTSPIFCDLIQDPEKYNGKQVIIRATYRYGFEWSELYCLDCMDHGKVWLDLTTPLDDTSVKLFKKMPKGAGIANLTVQGVFVSGSTFGHSNSYDYKIEPTKISDVVVLEKGMKSLEQEKIVEKHWACGGTNPA